VPIQNLVIKIGLEKCRYKFDFFLANEDMDFLNDLDMELKMIKKRLRKTTYRYS